MASQMESGSPADNFTIDAFISYAPRDIGFARKLKEGVEGQGKRVLMDLSVMFPDGGAQEPLQTANAIENAHSFIYIISAQSLGSETCITNFNLARRMNKRILCARIQPITKLPTELDSFQEIDFTQPQRFDVSLRELLFALDQTNPLETPTQQTQAEVSEPPPDEALTLKLVPPNGTVVEEMMATEALIHLLARASRINQAYEEGFDLSFSSMLLAFLSADDALSRWLARYVTETGIVIDALLQARGLERARFDELAAQPLTQEESSPLSATRVHTQSARDLLGAALDFLMESPNPYQGSPPVAFLDVRHLMAAYIYNPAGHEKDLEGLGFDRADWSNAFLGQMTKFFPDELDFWKEKHRRAFSSEPEPIEELEGPSTHIASDMWTLNDTLGYRAYAHAIYRFMTHRQTRAPLTISIQAPWGGGKTSLMRMIQHALDPEAFAEVKDEATQPRGLFTVKEALNEIERWIEAKTPEALPSVPKDKEGQRLTVWFNAWKYESVNQIWAGMVDAIMQQIAARLPLKERELFWLRLNLKRIDADRIRQRIHERIFRYWWRGMRYLLVVVPALIAAFIAVWLLATGPVANIGGAGASLSLIGGLGLAFSKYLKAKTKVEEEPAAVSLSEYLDIPNYSAEIGFIHRVEADLRRVLASVPKQYYPIVIFIDDLDRCSPVKVAQVVEAVNLFLAGDFPNCMFVMGMDTEMVAAALQAAHKDMISCLPTDAGIPVGWRFMDKFVQLPFLIPPTEKGNLERYTASLFAAAQVTTPDPRVDELAREAAARITSRHAVASETARLSQEHGLSEREVERVKDQLEARLVERKLDEGIEKFTDENPEIQRVIAAATAYFRGNPRELKRFINAFRFQYFLWWAQRAQGLDVPSLDQLRRWTVLSMKWPEVVRWLRRSGGSEWRVAAADKPKEDGAAASLPSRLKLLEEISDGAEDLATWQKRALAELRLKAETTSWLNDDDLLQFFYEECEQSPVGERLSDGLGKGLW